MSTNTRSRSRTRRSTIPVPVPRPRSIAPVINVVTPRPVASKRSRSRSATRRAVKRDFFTDTMHALFAPFSDTNRSGVLTVMFILSTAAIYLHYADPSNSWIVSLGKTLSATVIFKPIGNFITDNPIKIIGLVLLIPSVCCPPPSISLTIAKGGSIKTPSPLMLYALFSLVILWVKAYTFYDYVLYSVCVYLLLQLKTNFHRLLILALLILGWAILNGATPAPPTTSTNQRNSSG